jgi:molecular chaperone GrpE
MSQPSNPESQADSDLIAEVLQQTNAAFEEAANAEAEPTIESVETDVAELQKQLEQAQQQANENWDKALRIQAEMENLKRRVHKDLDDERKFGISKFAKELLTVIDSLELGLQAANNDGWSVEKLREGSELTIRQFESVFAKFNIETVSPMGQPFNPELHQAMSIQPADNVEPNTVLAVFQKGYILNGRLLRPAMVVVSKQEPKAPETVKIDEQA